MQAHDTAPLQQFGSQFDNVNFRKGLQLNFTSNKDGSLITQIDNKQVGHYHQLNLCTLDLTRQHQSCIAVIQPGALGGVCVLDAVVLCIMCKLKRLLLPCYVTCARQMSDRSGHWPLVGMCKGACSPIPKCLADKIMLDFSWLKLHLLRASDCQMKVCMCDCNCTHVSPQCTSQHASSVTFITMDFASICTKL